MADVVSRVTQLLRRVAGVLPDGRVRRTLSGGWNAALRATGHRHLAVPLAGTTVRLGVRFRHLDPGYEAQAIDTWLRLLTSGDVVWDVGANIGLYTLLTARAVGSTGRVVAWEPSPDTFRVLSDHVGANAVGGWCELRNAAVADAPGTLPFAVSSEGNDSTNRLGKVGGSTTVPVTVETLDALLDVSARLPVAVKIDIEGAEVLALRGARRLLAAGGPRPVFMVAVHPMFLPEFGCDPGELAAIAGRTGYTWTDLTGTSTAPVEYAEYLLVPNERRETICQRLGWTG